MSFDQTSHGYESWDLSGPPNPPPTWLFSLEPIGVGTADVESLTGYIARLAEAHSVRTSRLVATVLVPRLERRYLQAHPDIGLSSVWSGSHAMNGALALARDTVTALEAATGRTGLRCLTLSPWAHVLDLKGLLRRDRAWCAACYHEWRQHGRPIHERLLWSLAPVLICPDHGQPLETRCPHATCGRTSVWLATRSRPGHCSRCGQWLGDERRAIESARPGDVQRARDTWVGRVLGELLAGGLSRGAEATGQVIAESILQCARLMARGKISRFARLCSMDVDTVHQWRHGTRPGWRMLLRICWRLGVSPVEFLTRPRSLTPNVVNPVEALPGGWLTSTPRRGPRDHSAIRYQLQNVINAEGERPLSARQVARTLGIPYEEAYAHYPDLMRQISSKYRVAQHQGSQRRLERIRSEVREAVAQLHAQGVYPSVNRVRASLSHPVLLRLPAARQAWLDALREHGWGMGGHRTKAHQEIPSGHRKLTSRAGDAEEG
jgi:TniQ